MNKRFQIARIAVYVTTVLLVTVVIAYQTTITPSMIAISLSVAIIGAVLLLLFDKLEDCESAVSLDARIKPDLKTLIVTTFRKKPYVSIYEGDLTESEISKNSPAQPFMLAPKPLFFMVFVNLLGTIVRVVFLPFQSSDFISQQLYWHGQLAGKGLDALSMSIPDFSPLYSTVFALLCQTNLSVQFITKIIPATVDFVLAMTALLIFHEVTDGQSTLRDRVILYGAVLFNPLLILNASCWGQFDSIHTTFIFLCIYVLIRCIKHRAKYGGDLAMIFLGLAYSFKYQTICILPITLFIWLVQKEKILKISQKIWIPAIYFLTCVPLIIKGHPLNELVGVYIDQAKNVNTALTTRYPNFYTFVGLFTKEPPAYMAVVGMILTGVLLVSFYLYLFFKRIKLDSLLLLKIAVLVILSMAFFLPFMHERYAFVGEMIIVILAFLDKNYFVYSATTIIVTLFEYVRFLLYSNETGSPLDILFALLRLTVIVLIAQDVIKKANDDYKKTVLRGGRRVYGGTK